jgi:hypothetical protein
VVKLDGSDRQHRESALPDDERVFVCAVRRATILHHAQPPRADLLGHAVVECDHAIGHVFLQPVARDRGLALLAGDDRRHAADLHRLPAPCRAAHEGGPPAWQSTASDFVESGDARRCLGQTVRDAPIASRVRHVLCHMPSLQARVNADSNSDKDQTLSGPSARGAG